MEDKEKRDRVSDTCKEQIKLRFEFLRIWIFFLAAVGSGTISLAIKTKIDQKESIVVVVGFIFCMFILTMLFWVIKKIFYYLNELKKLESC